MNSRTEIDPKLWSTVCEVVRAETADLVTAGRVTVEEKLPGPDGKAVVNGPLSGAWAGIEIRPTAKGAPPLYLDLYGPFVALGPGTNGAILQVDSSVEPDFAEILSALIRSVRDGQYTEQVTRGDEARGDDYAYAVDMRFGGLPDGRGESRYTSQPEPEHSITEGENTYPAWR